MSRRFKGKVIVILAAITSAFVLLGVAFGLFYNNYNEIYHLPRSANGVMDAAEYDLDTNKLEAVLNGKWEFFYDKWIVSEHYGGAPDTMLEMPGFWTDAGYGREACASYRMVVKNLPPGAEITVIMVSCPIGYRTFVNGELCAVAGTVSKDISESFPEPHPGKKKPITIPESGEAVVVVELATSNYGGLPTVASVRAERENISQTRYTSFGYIVFGIMIAFVLLDLVLNLGFLGGQRQLSSVLLLVSVVLHFFTSKEIYLKPGIYFTGVDYGIILNLNFITGVLMLVVYLHHMIKTKQVKANMTGILAIFVPAVIGITGYFLLKGYAWQLVAALAAFSGSGYLFFVLAKNAARGQRFSVIQIGMLFVMAVAFNMQLLDNLGFIFVLMETPMSIFMLLFSTVLSCQTFIRIRESATAQLKTLQLEQEVNAVKRVAYQAQVNPHFIFNVLSGIEDLYEKDTKRGAKALQQFASHLRQHIDSGNRDLITFTAELDNVLNYVALENLRREESVEVLFDIEFQDFYVPTLSLQPLIDNAIRHAGITKKKDGIVSIRSERTAENTVRITVSDNGSGFDPAKIRQNATGLHNTTERFRLLLNATMHIASTPGEGTEITILIPLVNSPSGVLAGAQR